MDEQTEAFDHDMDVAYDLLIELTHRHDAVALAEGALFFAAVIARMTGADEAAFLATARETFAASEAEAKAASEGG